MSKWEYLGYGYLIYSILFCIFFPKILALIEKDSNYFPRSVKDGRVTWRYIFKGILLGLVPSFNIGLPCGLIVYGIIRLYENINKKEWLDKKVFK